MTEQANNPAGLRKSILPMSLVGMNEWVIPEKSNNAFEVLENVTFNRDQSYWQRPGVSNLTKNGTIDVGLKLFRTQNSVGQVGDTGKLFHYGPSVGPVEGPGGFSKAGVWSVVGTAMGSSSGLRPGPSGQRVLAVASSSVYDVCVYEGGPTLTSSAGAKEAIMSVVHSATGVQVAQYSLTNIVADFLSSGIPTVKIAVVNDRYLHVWYYGNNLGNLYALSHDMSSGWPSTFTFTNTGIVGAGNSIDDIAPDNTNGLCHVCFNSTDIITQTNAGSVSSNTHAGWSIYSIYCDGTTLWVSGSDGVSPNQSSMGLATTNTASITVAAWADAAVAQGIHNICYDGTLLWFVIQDVGSTAFGSTFIPRIRVYNASPSGNMTLRATVYGYVAVSKPFVGADLLTYLHVCKGDSSESVKHTKLDLSPHCILDLTSYRTQKWASGGGAPTTSIISPAAAIETFVGYRFDATPTLSPQGTSAPVYLRYMSPDSGYTYSAGACIQTASRTGAPVLYKLRLLDSQRNWNATQFGGETVLGGGLCSVYDGLTCFEAGFLDYPIMDVQDSGAAGVVNGSYKYVAVFRHVDSRGVVTHSRVFGPVSLSVVNKQVTITVQAPHVTSRELGKSGQHGTTVDVYRTESAGTIYRLVASSQANNTSTGSWAQLTLQASGYFTGTDNMADSTLTGMPELFRQPGILGTAQDRYSPPPGQAICSHKDRVFVSDQYGQRVFFSSFFVDGEGPWFSPLFAIVPHGGSGQITGIASMDGRLFIFKKNGVWVVDGDGPPENGGSGAEFSPPQRLNIEFGCIEPRSIVNTPLGIMYQSSRGIELLTRSLSSEWVGKEIVGTLASYPYCTGSCFDVTEGIAMFSLANQLNSYNSADASSTGVIAVMDMDSGWTTRKYWVASNYGGAWAGIVCVDGQNYFVSPQGTICREDKTVGLDNGNFVPVIIRTAWVRTGAGPMDKQRVYDLFILGKKEDNHAMSVEFGYDFKPTWGTKKTWQPGALNPYPVLRVDAQPSQEANSAIRARITTELPSDTVTYPVTTGLGARFYDISWQIAAKENGPNIAAAQKG